jgi:cytoskeletal protein RodZ
MTNYPRDEFDRVPEFNNRSGSHRENGWAAAASVGGARSGLSWLMTFGVIALVVGLLSFTVLPKFVATSKDPAPVAASSSSSDATATEATSSTEPSPSSESIEPSESVDPSESVEPSEEPSSEPSSSESESASPSDLPADVDATLAMGVYNGSETGGLAGIARAQLQSAGFVNAFADNWTKKVTYSTVYYRVESQKATAEAAAQELGITSVMQSANIPGNIAIVLGSTYS